MKLHKPCHLVKYYGVDKAVNTLLFKTTAKGRMIVLCVSSSTETLDVFAHEDAVYGLSVSPVNDNIFASSSDDGRVLIWDIRESSHGGEIFRWKRSLI